MIALPNYQPPRSLLPLVRTLFDITLLRKGPDSIPASGILLLLVIGLWLFASLAILALIEQYDERETRLLPLWLPRCAGHLPIPFIAE